MASLVDKEDWERGFTQPPSVAPGPTSRRGRRSLTRPYRDYLLLEVVYPRVLPDLRGRRLIEIGSAPGRHLAELSRRLGVEPFGVEHTAAGTAVNRAVFERRGIDPNNVFHADVFSRQFQERHRQAFDVVLSRGFIEHFPDLRPVIAGHLNLLKAGGFLIVMIPNLRGVYGWWLRRFDPRLLARHNLEVMRLEIFRGLFPTTELSSRWCGYLGTFDSYFLRAAEERSTAAHAAVRWLRRVQLPLNVLMRLVLRDRGLETAAWSPSLLYVGQKRGAC